MAHHTTSESVEIPPCKGNGSEDNDGYDSLEQTAGHLLESIEAHDDEYQNDDVM